MAVRTKSRFVEKQLELSKYAGQRKYRSQINQQEETIIWNRLKAIKDWGFSKHTFDRLQEKRIRATEKDIVSTIDNADIVEYKIDYIEKANRCDERVVLVSKALVNGCYNLKAVYSLTNQTIVTVWINHVNDKHSTLDWELYNADMKVFGAE